MDLINRQDAIEAIVNREMRTTRGTEYLNGYAQCQLDIIDIIQLLPSAQQWNPITKRPMNEEERKEWSERIGYDIEYEDAYIYGGLPNDGEEVLICMKWGSVTKDIFRDDDGCYFDDHDMEDVTAWMPLPEPWKGGTK